MDSPARAGSIYSGQLVMKPCSVPAILTEGNRRRSNGSQRETRDVRKVWADQPWGLIEIPARRQHISHPALHIANQTAYIHNAMIRGLNAIYLQAPHVHEAQDIADLLFLTQCWSKWVLDHHELKEKTMLPGFETVLGVPSGTLTLSSRSSISTKSSSAGEKIVDEKGEDGDEIAMLLKRVHTYASTIHSSPSTYDIQTLLSLLHSLAEQLVPHLTAQIGLLASMREMCYQHSTPETENSSKSQLTRTPSRVTFSLFPTLRPPTREKPHREKVPRQKEKYNLDATTRATDLTRLYVAAEAQASASADKFIVPPMIVRLRDVTFSSPSSSASSSSSGSGYGITESGGGGEWPWLSVLAVHAVADHLSPRHEGAWRFLPCDVWGRPRELRFLGC